MPAAEALTRLNQDPRLFSALLTDAVDAGPAEFRVCLPVVGGYGFVLDVDAAQGEQRLGLRGPASSEPVRLAAAHSGLPAPAALTFAELELCARVIALEDPWLPHPGPVVALLFRFAALDDDPTARVVSEAAFRSLRCDVPPTDDTSGPEQPPLPLFTDESWWPRPPRPSGQLLTDGEIAGILDSPSAGDGVRRTERFPAEGLAELVRLARDRLARLSAEPGCRDAAASALARRIAADADLRRVPELLAALTEAGCDHPTVLDALSEPLVPVEAWWMVETLAGAAHQSVLQRHLVSGGPLG